MQCLLIAVVAKRIPYVVKLGGRGRRSQSCRKPLHTWLTQQGYRSQRVSAGMGNRKRCDLSDGQGDEQNVCSNAAPHHHCFMTVSRQVSPQKNRDSLRVKMAFDSKKKHGLLVAAGLVFAALSVCCLLIQSASLSIQHSKLLSVEKPTGPFESAIDAVNLT